jgi:hypothetical protein
MWYNVSSLILYEKLIVYEHAKLGYLPGIH